ncbi:programmed cell death protein 2 [Epithele typhae]|uniref:programmed cell death protein 2 n=1 Tax=Epithele typhae TaxID=378194 RepID=UPI002007F85B|nr:programmed cell death protein 2 [Epithele typhae]KAH9935859.1 programmed cell death protein 2 [Epithele typhae]
MPPPATVDDSWSDSDDGLDADVETAVQLGVPDGPLESTADIVDPAVSRIGGHPAFLSAPPPIDLSHCKVCSAPMPLAIQIWCPLEDSPHDRVLFVWACPDGPCQRKEGSVRAWRELRFNATYAAKLEKKAARQKEVEAQKAKVAAEVSANHATPKTNPFALGASSAPNPFGLGSAVFGSPAPEEDSDAPGTTSASADASSDDVRDDSEDDDEDSSDSDSDDDRLAATLQAASLDDSPWKTAPAFPPLYLSTTSEYLPPPPKTKQIADAMLDTNGDADSKSKGASAWAPEGYENSMDVDQAFERFSKRVSYEGEQCLRYELGGTPLPYASDKVFNALFPVPPSPPLPVTKPGFMITTARKRMYVPETLPVCTSCKSRRVFECQLMPNLINTLKLPSKGVQKPQSSEERRAEVLRALKGGGEGSGMEWGTCMIFSCQKDCTDVKGADTWREEHVLVQWEE